MSQGGIYGLGFYSGGRHAVAGRIWAGTGLCALAATSARGAIMSEATNAVMSSGWMVLAAVLAAGVFVYLIAVLLRPEDFS